MREATAPVAPLPEGEEEEGSRRQGQGVGAACLPSLGPTDGVGTCEGRRGRDEAALHGHALAHWHAAARVPATEGGSTYLRPRMEEEGMR